MTAAGIELRPRDQEHLEQQRWILKDGYLSPASNPKLTIAADNHNRLLTSTVCSACIKDSPVDSIVLDRNRQRGGSAKVKDCGPVSLPPPLPWLQPQQLRGFVPMRPLETKQPSRQRTLASKSLTDDKSKSCINDTCTGTFSCLGLSVSRVPAAVKQ